VWIIDYGEHDPDSNYPEPSAKQLVYAYQACSELKRLKSTLEKLTVPQQRAILGTIANESAGGVFRRQPLKAASQSEGAIKAQRSA
jgi:hypothetical protein